MAPYDIRIIGDPVLRRRAADVTDVDSTLVRIVEGMVETMNSADGIGLAAPQVGVQKRLFVWDLGDGPRTIINPQIVESDGEWVYDEGCLSVPGLTWEILRPKQVHVVGRDLDGNEVSVEADELEARLFPARAGPPRRHLADRAPRRGHPQGRAAHASRAGDRARLDAHVPVDGHRRRRGFGRSAPAVTPPRWRVVYFGTPEVAVAPLQALYRAGHDVAAGSHPTAEAPGPAPGTDALAGGGRGRDPRSATDLRP